MLTAVLAALSLALLVAAGVFALLWRAASTQITDQAVLIRHQCERIHGYRAELDALSIAGPPPAALAVLTPDDPALLPAEIEQVATHQHPGVLMTDTEALRGPWLAVLADSDGFIYPTFDEAVKNLTVDEEMTIAVVRDSAMPIGDDPEELRMSGSYYSGDLIFEIDAYLVDDDASVGAAARYAQAQAMADGLNAAGGAK